MVFSGAQKNAITNYVNATSTTDTTANICLNGLNHTGLFFAFVHTKVLDDSENKNPKKSMSRIKSGITILIAIEPKSE